MIVNCIDCGAPLWSHAHAQSYRASNVKDWCARTGSRYHALIPARTGKTYAPYYGSGFGTGESTTYPQQEAYLAEIPNGVVIGGQGIVVAGDTVLFDPVFGPRSYRYRFTNDVLLEVTQESISVVYRHDEVVSLPKGILVQSWFGVNYHHWLVEHLSKLMLVDMANVPSDVPVLVDERVLAVRQLTEALAVVATRQIVPLRPNSEYRVEQLYLPSNLFGTGPDLESRLEVEIGDVTVDREAVDFLRSKMAASGSGHRRFYIDRRAISAPPRLLNGQEVMGVFCEFGFEVIYPAMLTFAAQQALFADASIIAGESGAAMTNMLLAPKETVMICLQSQRFPLNIYADLCAYGGQRSRFLVGNAEPVEPPTPSYQAPFTYDAGQLRRDLAGIL